MRFSSPAVWSRSVASTFDLVPRRGMTRSTRASPLPIIILAIPSSFVHASLIPPTEIPRNYDGAKICRFLNVRAFHHRSRCPRQGNQARVRKVDNHLESHDCMIGCTPAKIQNQLAARVSSRHGKHQCRLVQLDSPKPGSTASPSTHIPTRLRHGHARSIPRKPKGLYRSHVSTRTWLGDATIPRQLLRRSRTRVLGA